MPEMIGFRVWSPSLKHRKFRVVFYVSERPGEGGVDWGYVEDQKKATPLNTYWQRRFAADCRRVGSEARFIPCGREA